MAKDSLLRELGSWRGSLAWKNLDRTISEGRMGGIHSHISYHYSIGNLYTTTEENKASNITIHGLSNKQVGKFSIKEIFLDLFPERACQYCGDILPIHRKKYCSGAGHSCLKNYNSPHLKTK